ncbi:MAG: peptidoglycan DD-metalloendopeptidase family protein [Pseudomonadota bacterium]
MFSHFRRLTGRPRGATRVDDRPQFSHHHVLAVVAVSACVAIMASVVPSGDVKAKRSPAETDLESLAPASAPGTEPVASVASAIAEPLDETQDEKLQAAASLDALREAPRPSSPLWEEFIVRSGDNLSLLFKRAGFSTRDVYQIVNTAPQGRGLERMFPGQSIAFMRDEDGELAAVRHTIDRLQSVLYRRMDGGFSSERTVLEPETRESWASVRIDSSLFLAGKSAGLSSNLILEIANILGGVIDFVLDPRTGDTLELLYEEHYLDGEKYADGKVMAVAYTNRGERFEAYRYIDSTGATNYYSADGVSMRKAFLMAPVDFTRISSNFNPRRLHPIYKTVRPHNGTDYAAPRGTPVFAAGDGRVTKAGYTRANGNYVFIQHGERYVTKYLHLNKRKVKQGQRVVQSQVIGTVGSTGAATGPHLHYEFLVDGRHRNPRTIHKSLPKAQSLPAGEMPRFIEAIDRSVTQLTALREDRRMAASSEAQAPATP